MHSELWPGKPIPVMFLPTKAKPSIDNKRDRESVFVNQTIPTSMVFAYIAALVCNNKNFNGIQEVRRNSAKLLKQFIQAAVSAGFTSCRIKKFSSLDSDRWEAQEWTWGNDCTVSPTDFWETEYIAAIQPIWFEDFISPEKHWVGSHFSGLHLGDLVNFSLIPLTYKQRNSGRINDRKHRIQLFSQLRANALLIIGHAAVFLERNLSKLTEPIRTITMGQRKRSRMNPDEIVNIVASAAKLLFDSEDTCNQNTLTF